MSSSPHSETTLLITKRLFFSRNSVSWSHTIDSNTLASAGSTEIGQLLLITCLSPVLNTGLTLASFHLAGVHPCWRLELKRAGYTGCNCWSDHLSSLGDNMSGPVDLCSLRELMINLCKTVSSSIGVNWNLVCVGCTALVRSPGASSDSDSR